MSDTGEGLANLRDQLASISLSVQDLAALQWALLRELALLRRLEGQLFDPDGRLPAREEFIKRAVIWYDSMCEGKGA